MSDSTKITLELTPEQMADLKKLFNLALIKAGEMGAGIDASAAVNSILTATLTLPQQPSGKSDL